MARKYADKIRQPDFLITLNKLEQTLQLKTKSKPFILYWSVFTSYKLNNQIILRHSNQVLQKDHSLREYEWWLCTWKVFCWFGVVVLFLVLFLFFCRIAHWEVHWLVQASMQPSSVVSGFSVLDFSVFWWCLSNNTNMSLLTLDFFLWVGFLSW